MWDIVRTKPGGVHIGKALPIFINNFHFHLTTIDVYDDGAVYVWEFLDLDLFDEKLKTSWLNTSPEKNGLISVYNLGAARNTKGKWDCSLKDIRERVRSIVRDFDPGLKNVIDMQGSSTCTKGKIRMAKMGLADDCPFRTDSKGERVFCREIPVFQPDGRDYRLVKWFVFSDGTSRVGFDSDLVSFDSVCTALTNGELTTNADDAAWIIVPGLGRFKPADAHWYIQPDQRIIEANDLLHQLRGGQGAIMDCMEAFRVYQEQPNDQTRAELRDAYEAVPVHRRVFCGDMDSKDQPIRAILYPNETPDYPL